MNLKIVLLSLIAFTTVAAPSCSVASRRSGVENVWRQAGADKLQPGVSTTKDVLAALGPPSQILDLGDRMCFYYLLEHTDSGSLFLVVYNTYESTVTYDRAVFFFDKQGKLEEMAMSAEGLPTSKELAGTQEATASKEQK